MKILSLLGQVIKISDINYPAPHCCGFKPHQELWVLSCQEAI
jgi:hypothetical protein